MVRFIVYVVCVVFAGNDIDVMFTDDQDDNLSLFVDLLLLTISLSFTRVHVKLCSGPRFCSHTTDQCRTNH